MSERQCPCCSGRPYQQCCQALHSQSQLAATAEALMRSRFSAFALQLTDYLLQTWHPSSRPLAIDRATIPAWTGLEIVACDTSGKPAEAFVEFKAYYRDRELLHCLHERSRFTYEQGRWFYLDGQLLPPEAPQKISRNQACPCGSGKKFKRCCL